MKYCYKLLPTVQIRLRTYSSWHLQLLKIVVTVKAAHLEHLTVLLLPLLLTVIAYNDN